MKSVIISGAKWWDLRVNGLDLSRISASFFTLRVLQGVVLE